MLRMLPSIGGKQCLRWSLARERQGQKEESKNDDEERSDAWEDGVHRHRVSFATLSPDKHPPTSFASSTGPHKRNLLLTITVSEISKN